MKQKKPVRFLVLYNCDDLPYKYKYIEQSDINKEIAKFRLKESKYSIKILCINDENIIFNPFAPKKYTSFSISFK